MSLAPLDRSPPSVIRRYSIYSPLVARGNSNYLSPLHPKSPSPPLSLFPLLRRYRPAQQQTTSLVIDSHSLNDLRIHVEQVQATHIHHHQSSDPHRAAGEAPRSRLENQARKEQGVERRVSRNYTKDARIPLRRIVRYRSALIYHRV